MLIASHIIVAGYVGERIGNPFLAFFVGIVIHFILDSIPHYDMTDDGEFTKRQWALMIVDAIIGFLVIVFILKPSLNIHSSFLWGAIGGLMPDFFDVTPGFREIIWKTKWGKAFHEFNCKIQSKNLPPIPGLLVQVFIIILFSFLYLHK